MLTLNLRTPFMEKSNSEILKRLYETGTCVFSNESFEGSPETNVNVTIYLRRLKDDPISYRLRDKGISISQNEACFILSVEEAGKPSSLWQNPQAMKGYFEERIKDLKTDQSTIFIQKEKSDGNHFLLKYKVLLKTSDVGRIGEIARNLYNGIKEMALSV